MARAGGTPSSAVTLTHVAPPISSPFGSASPVESQRIVAIDVPAGQPPAQVSFLDGIQRYAVEARFGVAPIVRGYVAAAILCRCDSDLEVERCVTEEFLVVPRARLTALQLTEIESVELPVYDCEVGDRWHPLLDVRSASIVVERRRESIESELARSHVAACPNDWLVVDGSLTKLSGVLGTGPRVVGLIKTHETQFLQGRDLEVALTLPVGHRTSVFRRTSGEREGAYSWYLRLWPWDEHDLLHGLVRVERPPTDETVADASMVSGWLLAERAPLAAPDGRWDRLLYPIRQVETYLRAQLGGWW